MSKTIIHSYTLHERFKRWDRSLRSYIHVVPPGNGKWPAGQDKAGDQQSPSLSGHSSFLEVTLLPLPSLLPTCFQRIHSSAQTLALLKGLLIEKSHRTCHVSDPNAH